MVEWGIVYASEARRHFVAVDLLKFGQLAARDRAFLFRAGHG
jgi:hypothetical protein